MCPDAKGEDTDREGRVHDEFEAEEPSPRESRKDQAHESHRWQDENIDFRVPPEPEEMLPEKRSTSLNNEVRRSEVSIEE